MTTISPQHICLLPAAEQKLRLGKLALKSPALVCDNATLFYLTGRVFAGYMFIRPDETTPTYFVKRPVNLAGENIVRIRKPEDIIGTTDPVAELGLELASLPYSDVLRLQKALQAGSLVDVSSLLMTARSVKTPYEIALLKDDGIRHTEIYSRIPSLYREGMTDVELQIEIERESRLKGCLGIFRVNGPSMELHMGNVLAGDNADAPSPYDFAMGGAGMHPSIPVGASGEIIRPGDAVMIDMNGNFNGYMTDMTRTFSCGTLSPLAMKAHQCSIAICHRLAEIGVPGAEAKVLYEEARAMAAAEGLEEYFMGHRSHAGFVGHGIGIQVNELPVIAPRSRHILEENNVIALEPKFVIPGTGAVGVENTYVVTASGMRPITNAPEQIIDLLP
ncbi:MAG: Xaa-Pro peptidase family protein [Muribaculaceae bacterium]|nr:Xaa-Pro peptidase family protein [Muribaculaceae bacterium]